MQRKTSLLEWWWLISEKRCDGNVLEYRIWCVRFTIDDTLVTQP